VAGDLGIRSAKKVGKVEVSESNVLEVIISQSPHFFAMNAGTPNMSLVRIADEHHGASGQVCRTPRLWPEYRHRGPGSAFGSPIKLTATRKGRRLPRMVVSHSEAMCYPVLHALKAWAPSTDVLVK